MGWNADVAQLAEQLICNQQVDGSIPFTSSIKDKKYQHFRVLVFFCASRISSTLFSEIYFKPLGLAVQRCKGGKILSEVIVTYGANMYEL